MEAILLANYFGLIFSFALLALSGCSSQQLYNTGQSYQRNQCLNMPDQAERDRCLGKTDTRYDDYRRDTTANPN
jgi:hypothetical protein